jgi:transposase-like protein
MKGEIDTTRFFCPNKTCRNYGRVGPDNQIVRAGYYGNGENKTLMLKCNVCEKRFSIRRGTPLFNLKTDEETFYRTIACLAEGNGLRATARMMGLDKDTVRRWLERVYQYAKKMSRKGLHFEDIQTDELRSFLQQRK